MKKLFLTSLFALSIVTSVPVAKVEAMNTSFVRNLKQGATEILKFEQAAIEILKNNKSDLLKAKIYFLIYFASLPIKNFQKKQFILGLIKLFPCIAGLYNAYKTLSQSSIQNIDQALILFFLSAMPSTLGYLLFNREDNALRNQMDDKLQQKINQLILWYKFKKLLTPRIISQPCSVCLEDNNSILTSGSTPCGHTFHADCIRPWLETRLTCPNCRANL